MKNIKSISTALSARQRNLQKLMSLTEYIQELAEANDWVAALNEQRQRRVLMDEFFAITCTPAESSDVAKVIENILAVDQSVSEMLYRQRGTMAQEASQSCKNIRNVDRYLSNSPL